MQGACITRARSGFTLVELLVVISIIGVLVALLLPAVQSARESARRLQCQNNLKQLGLACYNYQSVKKVFPPSSIWYNATEGGINSTNNANLNANWAILILPYIEQQNLYDAFDFSVGIPNAKNAAPRSVRLTAMQCPSDSYSTKPFNGSVNANTNKLGDNWARGNYAANAAMGFMTVTAHSENSAATVDSPSWQNPKRRGVMGANVSVGLAKIRDGASNTLLLAEIRAGVVAFDSRGVWAMSGGCPSALWGHGDVGDCNGPNSPSLNADDLLGCDAVRAAVGEDAGKPVGTRLQRMGMPCSASSRANYQQTARSQHSGGVFTVFADGSVHFISDYIDIVGSTGKLSAWEKLNASSDGEVLSASQY